MPSNVQKLQRSDLEGMHTGSLMSRRRALLACEESLEGADRGDGYQVAADFIEFKKSDDWIRAYDDLKAVLNTREHWKAPK